MVVVPLCRWLLQSSGGGGGDRKAKGCALALCAPGTSDCLCVWPPATNKKAVSLCLGTSHKSTHAHTVSQSAWGPELHLFEPTLGSHPQKQNTAHTPFRSQFVLASGEACAALCWEFCEGLFALDVQPKRRSGLCVGGMCSSLLRRPPFENAGGSVGDGKSPHLASFHPPT